MATRQSPLIWLALGGLALGPVLFSLALFRSQPEAVPPAVVASSKDGPILAPDAEVHALYGGSESCRECHETAYQAWKTSNHGLAEREVSPHWDEKAFTPKQTLHHGTETTETFRDSKGMAQIVIRGLDNQRRAYPVLRIIGHDPLRQFLVPAPGGRLQTCDVSYDPHKNELFDVFGDETREPGDWGNWTGQGMNWNAMCAACHNTRLRKNYDPATNAYQTKMAEMSVGCEACHGPMQDHVEWQRNKPPGDATKDPTIRKQSRDQMLDTCGACHARRSELSGDLIPGEPFADHFNLTVTDDSDTYYPDGQVRDENYEYTSFLSSRMHHAGIRCVDCHDPHSGKRLLPANQLCMRCHDGSTQPPAPIIDPLKHSGHKEGSSGNQCTACHMPLTTYMQRHPRRDHGMTSPDPLLTKEFGIPNACSTCHIDKDVAWALKTANEIYGAKLHRPARARAFTVARARRGDASAPAELIQLLQNEVIPVWQATACHLLARWVRDPEVTRALLDELDNPSPLVREAAIRSLTHLMRDNHDGVRQALLPMLDDPLRAVRIAAAWALCATLDLQTRAGRELCHMLDLNADQPTGRMQLSQFAFLRNDPKAAIQQMRKAISWDPNSPPFHHDLAILLSSTGDLPGAIDSLQEAMRLAPREAEYPFKLALALNETGEVAQAAAALEKTVLLDPSHAPAWYNLGLARNALNQPQEAVAALLKGEAADASDSAIPYARATILARLGQRDAAIAAATRALQLQADFPEARQLIQSLSR